jgi:hypothetical protein
VGDVSPGEFAYRAVSVGVPNAHIHVRAGSGNELLHSKHLVSVRRRNFELSVWARNPLGPEPILLIVAIYPTPLFPVCIGKESDLVRVDLFVIYVVQVDGFLRRRLEDTILELRQFRKRGHNVGERTILAHPVFDSTGNEAFRSCGLLRHCLQLPRSGAKLCWRPRMLVPACFGFLSARLRQPAIDLTELESKDAVAEALPFGINRCDPPEPRPTTKNV